MTSVMDNDVVKGNSVKKEMFVIVAQNVTWIEPLAEVNFYQIMPSRVNSNDGSLGRIVIKNYNADSDVIDLSRFPSIRSLENLQYTEYPLTLYMPNGAVIVLADYETIGPISSKNFIFSDGSESKKTDKRHTKEGSSVAMNTTLIVFGALFGATFLFFRRYAIQEWWESAILKKGKKAKTTTVVPHSSVDPGYSTETSLASVPALPEIMTVKLISSAVRKNALWKEPILEEETLKWDESESQWDIDAASYNEDADDDDNDESCDLEDKSDEDSRSSPEPSDDIPDSETNHHGPDLDVSSGDDSDSVCSPQPSGGSEIFPFPGTSNSPFPIVFESLQFLDFIYNQYTMPSYFAFPSFSVVEYDHHEKDDVKDDPAPDEESGRTNSSMSENVENTNGCEAESNTSWNC